MRSQLNVLSAAIVSLFLLCIWDNRKRGELKAAVGAWSWLLDRSSSSLLCGNHHGQRVVFVCCNELQSKMQKNLHRTPRRDKTTCAESLNLAASLPLQRLSTQNLSRALQATDEAINC